MQLTKAEKKIIRNLNGLVIINNPESVINTFYTKNTTRPDDFTGEFFQTFKKEVIPMLHKFFRRIRGTTS